MTSFGGPVGCQSHLESFPYVGIQTWHLHVKQICPSIYLPTYSFQHPNIPWGATCVRHCMTSTYIGNWTCCVPSTNLQVFLWSDSWIDQLWHFPQINFPQTFLLCLSSSLSTFSRIRWADWSVIRSELDCEEWGGFRFRGKKSFLDFCCCCYSANLHTRGSRPATAQFWIFCCLTQLKFQTFCSSWEQSRWKQRTGHAVLTYEWNWNTLEFCRVTDLQVS